MTRPFTMFFALGFLFSATACTPAVPTEEAAPPPDQAAVSAPAEDVEATIAQLERDWVAAIVKKDEATLNRLLADEFAGVSPTAHYYNKDMAIADLTKGTYVVESMDLDDVSVNTYDDVAVSFASQEEKSRYAGEDVSGHYHFTNVWVQRDGRWQAVASHGTRYQTGH